MIATWTVAICLGPNLIPEKLGAFSSGTVSFQVCVAPPLMLTIGNTQIEQACWLLIVNIAALVPAASQRLIVADSFAERVANNGAIAPIVPFV